MTDTRAKEPPRQKLTVVSIDGVDAGGRHVHVRLEPAETDGVPGFEPGQYVVLAPLGGAPETPPPTPFSIASPPSRRDHIELYLGNLAEADPSSGLAAWIVDSGVGTELESQPPTGDLRLSRTERNDVVMVATGTGVAPFASILRESLLEAERDGSCGHRFVLLHGVRHEDELGFRHEFSEMARSSTLELAYLPAVSRPDGDPRPRYAQGRAIDLLGGLFGRPPSGSAPPRWGSARDAERLETLLRPDGAAVFLCGRYEFVVDCRELLAEAGLSTAGDAPQVVTESYI